MHLGFYIALENAVQFTLRILESLRNEKCVSWLRQSMSSNRWEWVQYLQSGDITVIGYVLTAFPPGRAGGQSCLQLFWLIVTWWQWQEGWAGLASETEHQPSLLAHIQPSALISRYVLTIALMWLLSGEALLPPSLPCVCNAPAASRL